MQWVANEGVGGQSWIKYGVIPEGYHSTLRDASTVLS